MSIVIPVYYRMLRGMMPGEARTIRPATAVESRAFRSLHGNHVVVCPRFPQPNMEHQTIQGIPAHGMLCEVEMGLRGDDVILKGVYDVWISEILEDVDTVEGMIVTGIIETSAFEP